MNSFKGLLLFGAQTLFLWMFLSASSVERMADGSDAATIVYRYAAEWRHGLSGFWPIYVPGFLAVAIATWVWSLERPLPTLLTELSLVTAAAGGLAYLLAPAGAEFILRDLHREAGFMVAGNLLRPGMQGVVVGLYSLLAWNATVLACNRALWRRSLKPLVVPAAMDVVLFFIRPYTFDDLISTWVQHVADGNFTALLSLLTVLVVSAWLVALQLGKIERTFCFLFGHRVDNRELAALNGRPSCRCGLPYLASDGSYTRVGHTLRCFFGGHHYRFAGARDGHYEYVCIRCGHPLLLPRTTHSQPRTSVFWKPVHYPCGVLGHKVHEVAERPDGVEFACFCGHSFVRKLSGERKIRHPWTCVFLGHFVSTTGRRFGLSEYMCRNCGHPFLFPVTAADRCLRPATRTCYQ